jgi:hypothetical protein
MNPAPSSPGRRDPAGDTLALLPVDGTHAHAASSRAALRPHTDESVTPDSLPPLRSPLAQGALLLAIYVAMYAAAGLVVEVVNAFAADVSSSMFAPVRDDGARPLRDIRDYASSDRGAACALA